MQEWSKEEITKWQNQKLKQLITHHYNNTPYIKNLFDKNNVYPEDIKTVDDLAAIPPINKNIIRENFDDLIPKNISKIRYKKASTSGSTGNPMRYYLDINTWSYTTAIKIYAWQTSSYLYGDKFVALGSSSLFPTNKKSWIHIFYFKLRNGIPLNGMNLSDEKLKGYTDLMKSKKVKYIYGYASAVYLVANYVLRNQLNLGIKGCFTTSEILTPDYRKEIEKAFNCKVMDCYGARDSGITAYEINPGYYYVSHNSYAELYDKFEKNKGSILVTDLLNYAFPFIRYDIGDEVEYLDENDKTDFNGQVFTEIIGRVSNIIKLDNGRVLTGPGFTILFKNLNVIAYRISQVGGMKLRFEVQKNEAYNIDDEKTILGTAKKHAGNDCEIELVYIDKFEPGKNGKRNFFLNN